MVQLEFIRPTINRTSCAVFGASDRSARCVTAERATDYRRLDLCVAVDLRDVSEAARALSCAVLVTIGRLERKCDDAVALCVKHT